VSQDGPPDAIPAGAIVGQTTRLPPFPDELLARRDAWAAVAWLNESGAPPGFRALHLRRYGAVTGVTIERAHVIAVGIRLPPE
jgi:hypothetical protein